MILYSDNFLEIRSNLNMFCMVIIIIKIQNIGNKILPMEDEHF